MGVYLSEINMPKGDGSKLVLQIFPNGEVYDEHGIRLGIANWAKAVTVPEHGRCIDADALKMDLTRFYDGEVTAKHLIDEQPTIIPADPEAVWCSDKRCTEDDSCLKCWLDWLRKEYKSEN